MNILNEILRANLERRHGRITFYPGNYVWEPTKAQLAALTHVHTSQDAAGRTVYLVGQLSVHCPDNGRDGSYPKRLDGVGYWVPVYVCRKCEHYRKGKRRGTPRYPCCAYLASVNAEADAAKDTVQAIAEAVEFAEEMIR